MICRLIALVAVCSIAAAAVGTADAQDVAQAAPASGTGTGTAAARGVGTSAEQILERAFANLYDVATTAVIELAIRDRSGHERLRTLVSASKVIGGRQHSIGRLVAPGYLRGMTILQVEATDRSHDAFVYMPSLGAVRRISTAQRGDALFGSDVTYEDLERRRIEDYQVVRVSEGLVQNEAVIRIRAQPRKARSFDSIRFDIARADAAVLGAAYFKRGEEAAFREITASRAAMHEKAGHTLPTRLVVENRNRGTTTLVVYRDLDIDPQIDDRLFSVRTLEQHGRIPRTRQTR
jgi:hypothetical protein